MRFPTYFFVMFAATLAPPLLAATAGPDAFGYTLADSAEVNGPEYHWVEISQTGEVLLDGNSGTPVASADLVTPVVIYGEAFGSLRVSQHGYISTRQLDDGADFTNDCVLPAVASSGSGDRIYALHDNLSFGLAGSKVLYEYFPTSPHPHHPCGVHVITWRDMKHSDAPLAGPFFSFQVLLFDNFDLLVQFAPGNPESGSGSTTGIQNDSASTSEVLADRSGLNYVCDSAGTLPGAGDPGLAVLFEPPHITVNTADDGFPPSPSETSFREAVADAASGTQIRFASSLSGATFDFDFVSPGNDIISTGGRQLAIDVPKNGLVENVTFASETILIDGGDHLSVSGISFQDAGLSSRDGVSLVVHGSEFSLKSLSRPVRMGLDDFLHVTDCRFIGNDGGISALSGSAVVVRDCYFLSNGIEPGALDDEGGAILAPGSTLDVIDSTFVSCEASSGGAIDSTGGDVTLVRSSFSSCTADGTGGAVRVFSGELAIDSCTFANNQSSSFGGGIYADGILTVVNSTFSENEGADGGAIYLADGSATIDHSTVVGNVPNGIKLGLDSDFISYGHCLFQENNDGGLNFGVSVFNGFAGLAQSTGYNLMDDTAFSPQTQPDPTDVTGADAQLGSFGYNGGATRTYALTVDSPAVDAGSPSITSQPDDDQRGFDRIAGGTIDIGAVELVSQQTVTTAIDEMVEPGTGLSLREAIDAAVPGSIITFDPALDGATIRLDTSGGPEGDLLIDAKDLTIDASALPSGIFIGGGSLTRVFRIQDAAVNLVNLHVRNGSSAPGGGFFVVDSELTMDGGSVVGCISSGFGGAFWFVGSGATLSDIDILDNRSSGVGEGGGAIDGIASELLIRNCRITSNEAVDGFGGAIFQRDSVTLEIRRTTLSGNVAGESGGALYIETGAHIDLENVTISGNESGTTSAGNASGGGIFSAGASGSIRHCTIANNRSKTGAGVVLGSLPDYNLEIGHTILDGNANPAAVSNLSGGLEVVTSGGYNLCSDGSLATWQTSTDQLYRPAFLAPLGDFGGQQRVHGLLAISPAIDAGDPAIIDAPGLDGRSFSRIRDGDRDGAATIDIGAFEAARPVIVTHAGDEASDDGERSLREALDLTSNGGRIVFDPSLSNATIDLSGTGGGIGSPLTIAGKRLQIDATALARGIELSGGGENRVFGIDTNATLNLHAISVIDGLNSSSGGGGIRVLGELLMTHGTLEGNRAVLGGAVAVEAKARAKLHNVTVSGNQAQVAGGGVVLSDSSARLVLEHATVTDNACNGSGAGGLALGAGRLIVYSSIIAGNTIGGNFSIADPNDFALQIDSRGYNLHDDVFAPLLVAFSAPGDQPDTAPGLLSLAASTGWARAHQLTAVSAARDAGDPAATGVPIMDARGFLRIADGRMDIGAVETNGGIQDSEVGGGDGMPDWWELRFGLNAFGDDSAENPDGDSATNLQEYQDGTNPLTNDELLVAAPPLIIAAYITTDPGDPSGTTQIFRIEWQGTAGGRYLIGESQDLSSWDDDSSRVASGSTDTFDYHFDASDPGLERVFFRISIAADQGGGGD